MLKRSFYLSITLLLITVVLQFVYGLVKVNHEINYQLKIGNEVYEIKEIYEKDKEYDDSYYYINASTKNKSYSFDIDNIFNGQKKILRDLEILTNENISCARPIFYKESGPSIACFNGDLELSFPNVEASININDFKSLANYSYLFKESNDATENGGLYYFPHNFSNNEYLALYRYNRIDVYSNQPFRDFVFAQGGNEMYRNDFGLMEGKYYLLPMVNNDNLIEGFYIVDIVTGLHNFVRFNSSLSSMSYILGVVDYNVYLIDRANKKEYRIDLKNATLYEVDSDGIGKYYNGSTFEDVKMTTLTNQVKPFEKTRYLALKDIEYKDASMDSRAYYYRDYNNNFYKVYRKNPKKKIYLFSNPSASNIRYSGGNIYYLDHDIIYKFTSFGPRKLIQYNELNYNNYNIFDVYVDRNAKKTK